MWKFHEKWFKVDGLRQTVLRSPIRWFTATQTFDKNRGKQ